MEFVRVRLRFRSGYLIIGVLIVATFAGGEIREFAERVIEIVTVYGVGRDAGFV